MANKREDQLQKSVCDYINYKYPNALYTSDSSGVRLTIGQAVAMKSLKKGRGWPDMFIAEPKGLFCGLFLELKREGEKIFNKKGEPRTPHLAEQDRMINELVMRGYHADFAVGLDQAMAIIDAYMNEEVIPLFIRE
jgi:hypothetical protein